jgi:hypothetical protein
MFHYDLPDNGPWTYKCVYKGGKEVRINSDLKYSDFIKIEKKSPDLCEVWRLLKSGSSETWEKIYPVKSPY